MPDPVPSDANVARVTLRADLVRGILGGVKYSRDAFEARLELLVVAQKELVRARREPIDVANLRAELAVVTEQSDAFEDELDRVVKELKNETELAATLKRERDEARRQVGMLEDELRMARFWYGVNNREISRSHAAERDLQNEVQILTIQDRVREVLLILAGVVVGSLLGYVYRPLLETPTDSDEVENETFVSSPTPHRPPAMPRAHEDRR